MNSALAHWCATRPAQTCQLAEAIVGRVLARVRRTHQAGRPGIEQHRRVGQLGGRERGEPLDALGARRERVGELARHGDDVMVGAADQRPGLAERLAQPLEPAAQRRGELGGADDPAVVGARRLEVHAPHIPADDSGHVRAIRVAGIDRRSPYTRGVIACEASTAPCAPSPRSAGERVGVRGASANADSATRGETPSPRPSPPEEGGEGAQAPCSPHMRRLTLCRG